MFICIDTTSQEAGITLVGKKTVRAPMDPMNSSEQIFEKIDEVMKQAKIEPSDLTAVFVIKGPGSFTGLRVGITVANQFAHQLKIPIVGVTTDEWWSHRASESDAMYLQTLNKDELYVSQKGKPAIVSHAELACLSGRQVSASTKTQWFGQISPAHRAGLPKNFTEITDLLSPEKTWELVTFNFKFLTSKKYDLVEPFYGKEAKITERKTK